MKLEMLKRVFDQLRVRHRWPLKKADGIDQAEGLSQRGLANWTEGGSNEIVTIGLFVGRATRS